jgi:Family of unknown function (DUF695)
MPLFSRKEEPYVPDRPETAGWSVVQAERAGKPLILRRNEEAPGTGRGRFPFRFGIAVRCRKARRDGLPGEADLRVLAEIEDAVERALPEGEGILAFVVTTGGMREFVGYVKEKASVESIWQQAHAAGNGYEVQGYAKADPRWEGWEEFNPTTEATS